MKEFLKELYNDSPRDFDVWNYLWLFSDSKHEIEFSHSELCGRFKVPLTTLNRILKKHPEYWNDEKCIVTYEKVGYKQFKISFFPKGKKAAKQVKPTIDDELYKWLKEYYKKIDFDYADLPKHKRYVKIIREKIESAMKSRNTLVTDESSFTTFQMFFGGIPEWWKENSTITLPLVSKHFTKILNQIKSNANGKKRDSFSKAAESADSIDFGKLAKNQ